MGNRILVSAPMLVPGHGVERGLVAIQSAHGRVDGLLHRGVVAGKPAEFCFQLAGAADELRTPIRQAGARRLCPPTAVPSAVTRVTGLIDHEGSRMRALSRA
jgi:hypothetical protein